MMKIKLIALFALLLTNFGCVVIIKDDLHPGTINSDQIYDVKPDLDICLAGTLKPEVYEEALERVNYIRSLHGLPPVLYKSSDDIYTRHASLITAANNEITHSPDSRSECYSTEGDIGCQSSNLSGGQLNSERSLPSTESDIDGWITEINNLETVVGHRRWILNPFLTHISYGRVDGRAHGKVFHGSALKVINEEQADISNLPIDFISYPSGDYPKELFPGGVFLSFSALIDKESAWNNSDVDYTNVEITVTDDQGHSLKVSSISNDNVGYGLPNSVQWKTAGIENNTLYTVSIKGVKVRQAQKEYKYSFRVI